MSDLKVAPVVAQDDSDLPTGLADGQLLVLVLDINPNQPFFARTPQNLVHWLDAALALVNSHLMLRTNNSAAVVAAHGLGCSFLHPAPKTDEDQGDDVADAQFEGFRAVETAVRREVRKILWKETDAGKPVCVESLLAGALGMALAYINRSRQEVAEATAGNDRLAARILVMSASGDTTSQYMTYMNAFFSAQKMQVGIDTCMIEQDSGLLQQGADITGGVYQRITIKHFPALLQFLIWMFLPDGNMRDQLSLPSAERVDYRAACFCHRELIDIGYVCSVCLSIFCKFSPMCTTCHTFFKAPGPLPIMAKKKKSSAAGGAKK